MTLEPEVRMLAAVGDPVRAALVRALARRGPTSTTALAAPLEVTRQAVDKHLRVLREVGVVSSARHGREMRHSLEPAALDAAASWLEAIGREWERQFALVKRAAESPRGS